MLYNEVKIPDIERILSITYVNEGKIQYIRIDKIAEVEDITTIFFINYIISDFQIDQNIQGATSINCLYL